MGEETRLKDLKNLYDELWRDARTLVKDLNRNIRAVPFFGGLCFFAALFELSTVTSSLDKVQAGTARWPIDYVYLGGGVAGVAAFIVLGALMLWWYSALRKKYRKLIELEKELGEQ